MTTKAPIVNKRSVIALLLLAVVLLAMHVLGSMQPTQSSLGAVGRIALDDDPWGSVNFSDFSTTQSNYVPESYNGNYNYDYGTSYSSGGSDFSVSDTYYGGYAPSTGVSDYDTSSWNSAPTYLDYGDKSTTGAEQYYSNDWSTYEGSYKPYSVSGSFYGSGNVVNPADYSAFYDGSYTFNPVNETYWQDNSGYWPTSGFDTSSFYWGDNSNTFVNGESYYNYQNELTSGFGNLGFYGGESAGVQGVYYGDSSFNYSDMYNDPTGMGYYNVPGTDYYGSGWGDTPTNTNYALNPSTYYYGSPDTYEYLNRCYSPAGDGTLTQNADLYCGQGPSPTELYATYGDNYIDYTRYATGEGERCSLKDGTCTTEAAVAPTVRRTQSGAIIDSSVSSFYGGVDAYGYDIVYDIPKVQYYSTPTTYRTVQQTTTAPRVQYIQAPVIQQTAARVQYVPTAIPAPVTPVLSAPAQLSCDIRIAHNGNYITVYYLTSSHTVRAYINNIGEVDPAVTTAKTKTVYPPFASAYIMTVYGAQGQTANCTAVTPTYTPTSVQYTTGQSYTYQPASQVYVSATQHPPTVDYVSVGELPYTGLEGTAYFFIVLFAAAASIGALFMYQEVFVSEASGVLTGMLGMRRFRRLGKKIETATHHDVFEDIPRDQ